MFSDKLPRKLSPWSMSSFMYFPFTQLAVQMVSTDIDLYCLSFAEVWSVGQHLFVSKLYYCKISHRLPKPNIICSNVLCVHCIDGVWVWIQMRVYYRILTPFKQLSYNMPYKFCHIEKRKCQPEKSFWKASANG